MTFEGRAWRGARIEVMRMTAETTRTLVADKSDETFELDPAEESKLLAAIAEADRGELIGATELLGRIRAS